MNSCFGCPRLGLKSSSPFASLLLRLKSKAIIDYTKFPQLNEPDLEEQFVHGSGPGGSKVNTSSNCVVLKHIPSGLVVKCHQSRELSKNRLLARTAIAHKLDRLLNGEESVLAQEKRLEEAKFRKLETKSIKIRELKKQFKKQEEVRKQQKEGIE